MSEHRYAHLEPEPELDDWNDRTPSSWAPVDMTDAVAGKDIPAPSLLERTDGVPLLYPGRVHWIQGESESLKSWVLQLGAAQVLMSGGTCCWIDFEDDDRGVASRLLALGVPGDLILDQQRFRYLRPDEPLYARDGAALPGFVDLEATVQAVQWDLVVIDGVTEAMTIEGMALIDNTDVARWMRRFPKHIADTGAAVGVIDHLTKAREGQGRYAIGGQHKLAGVGGAVYKVVATRRLSRATDGKPVTATSTITVEKDRPGWVRGKADDGTIAVLEITAYPDGGVTGRLLPPGEANTTPAWSTCLSVLDYLDQYEGAAKGVIERDIGGNAEALRKALQWMVGKQWIEVRKEGNAHRHYLMAAGRDARDGGGE